MLTPEERDELGKRMYNTLAHYVPWEMAYPQHRELYFRCVDVAIAFYDERQEPQKPQAGEAGEALW